MTATICCYWYCVAPKEVNTISRRCYRVLTVEYQRAAIGYLLGGGTKGVKNAVAYTYVCIYVDMYTHLNAYEFPAALNTK